MTVLKNMLTDAIDEQDFVELHESVNIYFTGIKPALRLVA